MILKCREIKDSFEKEIEILKNNLKQSNLELLSGKYIGTISKKRKKVYGKVKDINVRIDSNPYGGYFNPDFKMSIMIEYRPENAPLDTKILTISLNNDVQDIIYDDDLYSLKLQLEMLSREEL